MDNEHCVLIALPLGESPNDQIRQTESMRSGFINYLQEKRAAGIVNVTVAGASQVNLTILRFI